MTFKWNFTKGRDYYLGYHHGKVVGIGIMGAEEVTATFVDWPGSFDFVREKDGKLLHYRAQSDRLCWYDADEDSSGTPGVRAEFVGEIKEGGLLLAAKEALKIKNLEAKVSQQKSDSIRIKS